jgi:hypothetical protein
MVSKKLCIFCDNELNATTKPEHILLNALGGRMTTREAICSDCNNNFGGSIDNALTAQVAVIRNLLQLKSGTGSPPPSLKNLAAGADKISIGNDGRLKLEAPPFVATELPDGNHDVKIQVHSQEELNRILPHLAAKLKITEDELKRQIQNGTAAFVEKRPDTVHHHIPLGGEEALRSVVKSCLVLLATKVGTEALRADSFAAAKDFVLNGSANFNATRIHIDPRELPCAKELEREFGEFFNLIYVGSDSHGRVIGHFTLFNVTGWQVVVTEKDGPRDEKIGLASNPLHPPNWSGRIADRLDIPFSWLDTVDNTDHLVRAKERLLAMMALHVDQSRETEISRIVSSVCSRYGVTGDDDPIEGAHLDEIVKEVVARTGAHAAGVPHEDKLSPVRLKELLKISDSSEN